METPTKKGRLAKTEDGELVLVNDKNQAYSMDRSIIGIWDMLDGTKTVDNVVQEITQGSDSDPEQLAPQVTAIIEKMKEVGLVI